MSALRCSKHGTLTGKEKAAFAARLGQQGLAVDVFDLFGEWAARSTDRIEFFYLKVHANSALVGLGLLLRIRPFDLRTSYSRLRRRPTWSKLAGAVSALADNCLYVAFRNLITANLTRPFFCTTADLEDGVMEAILRWLRDRDDADMVSIVDTTVHEDVYRRVGFSRFPTSSEAFFDVGRYDDISQYLAGHRSLKRNLARRKNRVRTEIARGPVSANDREQIRACVACSAGLSKVNNPCQAFFEEHIFDTEVFNAERYTHIRVRVDDHIAGFHIFQTCGTHLGGVLGGFDRAYTRNNFVYERVIVASLQHALEQGLAQVHYSLVDNHTKRRLVPGREPCAVYSFARSPMNRKIFEATYEHSDMYDLFLLEADKPSG
ncbi:MAG: hypothetical protein JRI23_07330 [Deltaproteobacteria bacterium]|nr:hypothetical protein [Deltaproteobacteria bacterium]MBW2531405.1 hypothetical protein [Deltaproteobacteria bacterium]